MGEPEAAHLTLEEVASHCGVTRQTVVSWLQRGQLKAESTAVPCIKAKDLVHFMHQNHLAIPAELLSSETAVNASPDTPRVLVVDEDKPMANVIERALRNMGLEVIQVNNGFDAGVNYIRRKPQLMTLDLALEGMGGLELIEHIRATQKHKAKILVIANARPSLMAKAKAAGADAVLTKPFDNDSLRRTVRILLGW